MIGIARLGRSLAPLAVLAALLLIGPPARAGSLGPIVRLSHTGADTEFNLPSPGPPAVAFDADARRFLVAWPVSTSGGAADQLETELLDEAGDPIGAPQALPVPAGPVTAVSLVAVPGRGFLVLWVSSGGLPGGPSINELLDLAVNPDGTAAATPRLTVVRGPAANFGGSYTVTPDTIRDRFLVRWTSRPVDESPTRANRCLLDAAGSSLPRCGAVDAVAPPGKWIRGLSAAPRPGDRGFREFTAIEDRASGNANLYAGARVTVDELDRLGRRTAPPRTLGGIPDDSSPFPTVDPLASDARSLVVLTGIGSQLVVDRQVPPWGAEPLRAISHDGPGTDLQVEALAVSRDVRRRDDFVVWSTESACDTGPGNCSLAAPASLEGQRLDASGRPRRRYGISLSAPQPMGPATDPAVALDPGTGRRLLAWLGTAAVGPDSSLYMYPIPQYKLEVYVRTISP